MSCRAVIVAIVIGWCAVGTRPAVANGADKAAELNAEAQAALTSLYAAADGAKAPGAKATAILVFPKVTKAGLGIGGQHGTGTLFKQASRSLTTAHQVDHSASRPASRPMATPCSS